MTSLEEITLIRAPLDRCFLLSLSVEVHLLGNVHSGEQAVTLADDDRVKGTGILLLGDRVTWQARHFGVRQRLTSEITRYDRPHAFQDTMQAGAFAFMQHDHFFRQIAPDLTEMRDSFRYAAPLPVLGLIAEKLVLDRYMSELLRERNRIVRQIAESDDWKLYLDSNAAKSP